MQKQEFTTWFCKLYLPRKSELSLSADDSRINGNRRDEGLAITDPPRCVLHGYTLTLGMRWRSNARLVAGERKPILANIRKEARRKREKGWGELKPVWVGGKGWRNQERNDRLDSNQHFTACKTAPFRNIASSLLTPLTPRKFQSITALAWITCLDFLFFPFLRVFDRIYG